MATTRDKLLKFILDRKYNNFTFFLDGFFEFLKYDAKFNTLITNKEITVFKKNEGVKFLFSPPTNITRGDIENRDITHMFELIEDYLFLHQNNIGGDYNIVTNHNELSILFSPNFHLK